MGQVVHFIIARDQCRPLLPSKEQARPTGPQHHMAGTPSPPNPSRVPPSFRLEKENVPAI